MATQMIQRHARLIQRTILLDSCHTSTLKQQKKLTVVPLPKAKSTSHTGSASSSLLASTWVSHRWSLVSSPSYSTVQAQVSRSSLSTVTNSLGSLSSGTGSGVFSCDSKSQEELARVTTWRTGDKRFTSSTFKAFSCGLQAWLLLSFTVSTELTGWLRRAASLSRSAAEVRWNCMRSSEAID